MLVSFEDFYRSVTGKVPFAWQSRLAREVMTGTWPAYVALPTAAGKTSLAEIWAYALARELTQGLQRGLQSRRTPLRLVWVVDRRIIVDSVAERADHLAQVLQGAVGQPTHPLFELAGALRTLGGSAPLAVSQLRGGMAGQRQWIDAPNQPVVLATTVDQAGSRLLFRGYGVSSHQYSLEAGLLGCDTLVVVDEAHLSQPFVATLGAAQRLQDTAAHHIAPPLRVAVVSATLPSGGESERFTLTAQERAELAPRLARPKPAALVPTKRGDLAEALAAQARELHKTTPGGAVGVIVNRVDTARATFSLLAAECDAVLLTGRIRPHDRDVLLDTWWPRLRADRSRAVDMRPCLVVATQTVEVGADLDFDALVTEAAPFSALRQRFGRLNRLGTRDQAEAVIVQRSEKDGVYPHDIVKQVWEWLTAHANAAHDGQPPTINVSDEAIVGMLAQGEPPPEMALADAPVLTRMHLEHWSETSPVPNPDPDIAPFLHGKEQPSAADVQVIWRADLREGDLIRASDQPEKRAAVEERLSKQLDLAPPRVEEAISLPLWTVRRWLQGVRHDDAPFADVEAAGNPDAADATQEGRSRSALRWDGRNATLVLPTQIAPSDTIVLPAIYGGTDAFGWNPQSTEPVRDIGDLAGWTRYRRQHFRLHPLALPSLLAIGEDAEPWIAVLQAMLDELDAERHPDTDAARQAFSEQLVDYVNDLLPHTAADVHDLLGSWLASSGQWIPYPLDDAASRPYPPGVVLVWVTPETARAPRTDAIPDEADERSMVGVGRTQLARRVTLVEHSDAVAQCASGWATACGFPDHLVRTLEWAGRFHDLGKCEPRFQLMLHGGDEVAAALASVPLAKSGMDPYDRVRQDQARRLAHLPARMRHEAISARLLLDAYGELPADLDRELLCYLVGTHHGRGRPWFPVVEDTTPTNVTVTAFGYAFTGSSATNLERIDAGWVDLFTTLQRRYGIWGLAYIEAVLRLADHRVSSQEAQA